MYAGVSLVYCNGSVNYGAEQGLKIKRGLYVVKYLPYRGENSVNVYGKDFKEDISLIPKISVYYTCGYACVLCNLRSIGVKISVSCKKLVSRFYDTIFLVYATFLLWCSY